MHGNKKKNHTIGMLTGIRSVVALMELVLQTPTRPMDTTTGSFLLRGSLDLSLLAGIRMITPIPRTKLRAPTLLTIRQIVLIALMHNMDTVDMVITEASHLVTSLAPAPYLTSTF